MLPRQSNNGEKLLLTHYGVASAGRQCVAACIDVLLLMVTTVGIYLLTWNAVLTVLWALQCIVLMAIVEGTRGATPSKMLMGLRSVCAEGAARPSAGVMPAGMKRITIKYLILLGCGCVPVVGLLAAFASPLFSKGSSRQGWAERLAGIVIVDVHDASLISVERTVRKSDDHAAVSATDDSLDMRVMPPVGHRDLAANSQIGAMGEKPQQRITPRVVPEQVLPPRSPNMAVSPLPAVPAASMSARQIPNAAVPADENERQSIAVGEKPIGGQQARAHLTMPDLPSRPAEVADSPARNPQLLLFFENAQGIPLTSPATIVLGRKPQKQSAGDIVIPVKDSTSTVSRSHVRMELENGRIWLTDLGSTNGTQVICDGEEKRLDAHVRTEISSGARISLGDVDCSIATARKGTRA